MVDDYFVELKEWSARKHELLTKYLAGFARILKSSYYVDGFAGPGKYEDGQDGSPVLAAKLAEANPQYNLRCINVEVDEERFANLEANCQPYGAYVTNLKGEFGSHVDSITTRTANHSAVFFLDPFGVKGLEWKHISKILARPRITEVLVRINPIDLQRLAGFDDSDAHGAAAKRQDLADLFGFSDPSQWESIWQAEGVEGLVKLYVQRIRQRIATASRPSPYVEKYAIRSIEGEVKYYLVFATRDPKGAILMSDTICNREESYERDKKEYLAKQTTQTNFFDIVDPTEEQIKDRLVAELCVDIYDKFKGTSASREAVRGAMLTKWFGRAKGPHFTAAIKKMAEGGLIITVGGPPSKDETVLTFK